MSQESTPAPLFLIHGVGTSPALWDALVDHLPAQPTVAIDRVELARERPGFHALVDRAAAPCPPKAVIAGHSIGATVALADGAADPSSRLEWAESWCGALRAGDAAPHQFPEVGHSPALQAPGRCAELITRLTRTAGRAGRDDPP